jgi:hypothetical protein
MSKLRNFSTEWKEEIAQSDEIAQVTKTKWQRKTTSVNYTTVQEIGPLRFNNLTVGRTYRIILSAMFDNANNEDSEITVSNGDGSQILRLGLHQTLTGTMIPRISATAIFTYVGSSPIIFNKAGPGGTVLSGASAILEELPNHEQTTQWT